MLLVFRMALELSRVSIDSPEHPVNCSYVVSFVLHSCTDM